MTPHPNTKHGMWRSPEHTAWQNMKERCRRSSLKSYSDYGGRGIKVCDRWLGKDGFANFLSDVGLRPTKRHTLDRENNNGNYEPGNVRWVTRKVQSNNRRVRKVYPPRNLSGQFISLQ